MYRLNIIRWLILIPFVFYSKRQVALKTAVKMEDSFTIAFGSCSHEYDNQPMWKEIQKHHPDLWIWSGDNIYGDTGDMKVLWNKYLQQLSNQDYKRFKTQVPVIGTWDDHDYGINDGGKGYKQKVQSQELFLNFIEEDPASPRRNQQGIYASYLYELSNFSVKVLLLDTRYHRDTIMKKGRKYIPNVQGDILGKEQWQWLKNELNGSKADVHLLVSSIQVISNNHIYEKWGNFPNARQKLFNLISQSQAKGILMISGDRHIAEISQMKLEGLGYPLVDVTSSGLTHTWSKPRKEKNEYRLGPLIVALNYGLLEITSTEDKINVGVSICGLNDTTYYHHVLTY